MISERATALALRLRELREAHWPGVRLTQHQLCAALEVSAPLVSSWESRRAPKLPPMSRLEGYAAFFATRRSMDYDPPRLLPLSELDPEELEKYRKLLGELGRLRRQAMGGQHEHGEAHHDLGADAFAGNPFQFPPGESVTIICSEVPEDDLARIRYSDPASLDYIDLYKYSDLGALFEVHGHVRAANPRSLVTRRVLRELQEDDLTTHLVLLGGVDWNVITRRMLGIIGTPVLQVADWDDPRGPHFQVAAGGRTEAHYTVVEQVDDRAELVEDVAFLYRGRNPNNRLRTLTICNGMYARGVYGAVRVLTDETFRGRNVEYLRDRFGDAEEYSVLMRVRIQGGHVVTPDLTDPGTVLHEWPDHAA
ncbi:helix-turn-helix domain-containing protein [Herbidospora cretacea]|uniref:helix-turn-helix domain-containing protein n=1 Tax=Herbidospora cretacea TaxID=28444 RepID=UPI0012F7A56A|nr:helix-turn-helix transcriptional regulator [Herbidospora cretacea]